MNITRAVLALVMLLIVNITGCVSAQVKSGELSSQKHDIIIPPAKFAGPHDKKIWEGEIDGRTVAYFRLRKEQGTADVIVVTQDDLPQYFKRIEYLDEGGDGDLDMVKMDTYETAKGWRGSGITRDHKYGLGYADTRYKELLSEIKNAREHETTK